MAGLFKASVAGVAVHVAAALLARVAFPPPVGAPVAATPEQWSVDLLTPPPEAPSIPVPIAAEPAAPSRLRAPSLSTVATQAPALALAPPAEGESLESDEQAPSLPVSATPAPVASRAIDLGLDGRWALLPRNDRSAPSGAERAQRRLDASLAEDRVKRGQGRGVAFIAPLTASARAVGPLRGGATVVVVIDANGSLSSVQLASGAHAEWSAVVNAFRQQAKSKRISLPSGARGMTFTLSVRSAVLRPSGKGERAAAVETKKPSFEPDGLTLRGGFDVGDAAGKLQQVVTAELLSEDVL